MKIFPIILGICAVALSKLAITVPYFTLWLVVQLFLLWLAADFFTGIIHWWEDTYGNPKWPIIGKFVIKPNILHHNKPAEFLNGSYWDRTNTSFIGAGIVGILLWLVAGIHAWQMIVFLFFCAQGNQIHAFSHRPDKVNGKIILFLQKIGIFQSRKMHRWHHKAPYETNFCPMSAYVNPILNKIKFWRTMEKLILDLFKVDVLRNSPTRGG